MKDIYFTEQENKLLKALVKHYEKMIELKEEEIKELYKRINELEQGLNKPLRTI